MEGEVALTKPNSLEAEQSVIGTMIMDINTIDEASSALSKDDFYYQQYGIVFEAIVELKNEGKQVNLVTVVDRLKSKSAPPEVCDAKLLSYLAESVSISTDIKEYVDIVKRKSTLRYIIDKNAEVQKLCYKDTDDLDDILKITEDNYLNLLKKRGIEDSVPIDVIVDNAMETIRQAYNNKGHLPGLSTGFTDLDSMTAGLQKAELILVAARPSMGKTAFALNIAANVAFKQHKGVAIFSLEMSKESLVNRFFSIEAGIDAGKIRTGELEDSDWPKLIESADEIAGSNLIIDEATTLSEIRSKCGKYKEQHDIQLVIIDYLQLINSGGKSESRQQEISVISRSLKVMARELDIPVIAISQLNRGAESRDNKRPMLSDLRDSGAIEQDADVVMLLYRDEYYNPETASKGVSEVNIAKQRNGQTGTVELAWLAKYTRFADREKARRIVEED